jgi:hypothetical protein
MFNFKIWFSNNNPKINIPVVLIKIVVHIFIAKSEYTAEEINMPQHAGCVHLEMFTY